MLWRIIGQNYMYISVKIKAVIETTKDFSERGVMRWLNPGSFVSILKPKYQIHLSFDFHLGLLTLICHN